MQDDDLRRIQDESHAIYNQYGHYFDYVLVLRGADFESASRELLDVINRLDVEPQWVPVAWPRGISASIAAFLQPTTSCHPSPAPQSVRESTTSNKFIAVI